MASETQSRPRMAAPTHPWPPHDTEESILGTDLHQTTITNVRWGINEVAHLHQTPEQPVPWKALSQLALLGCLHPDGSTYRTYPDVFIYPRPVDERQGSFTLARDGAPILIVEVLSESTYEADLDLVYGKAYSYARAGVREYVTLDPTSQFLPEGIRAWRLTEGAYRPWEPEADGRWHSQQIEVALGLEGILAAVYTREGHRILREGEVEAEWARLQRDMEAERALLQRDMRDMEAERARLNEELARRDAEVERLRRLLDERG